MFITAVEENISFNKMIKCALQDIYLHNPNIKWNDIIGLDAAKQLVKEAVVYPIRVRMGRKPLGTYFCSLSIGQAICHIAIRKRMTGCFSVHKLTFCLCHNILSTLEHQGSVHSRQFEIMLHIG